MLNIRIGIRLKLLFLSLFLFAIPWLGYKYVWELETYLRTGQEQTMVGTARAVATALHERPALFDNQAAFLQDVKPGTDLYAHKIVDPIQLDGRLSDWIDYRHLTLTYGQQQLINASADYLPESLSFQHMVGQYRQYLYAMFEVIDDNLVYRAKNSLRVDRNDHLLIAMTAPDGEFQRFIVAPFEDGWVNAYLLADDPESLRPLRLDNSIQGHWRATEQGYNIELRFPLEIMSSSIAFAIVDVDDLATRDQQYLVGTADPNQSASLGTVLVPSPEIENIVKGLKYSNARVWVVDKHMRVLARSGSIHSATGLRPPAQRRDKESWWYQIEQNWLVPLYYYILTKPPADFIDELDNAFSLTGNDLDAALNGNPGSTWRLSPDNKAFILSAAHPIYIDEQVMGAVVVEQTTHGIRTLRNRALEQLFHVILAVVVLGTLALFIFASRISFRIRKLRNETESAIDTHGKIIGKIQPSKTRDEIGDLSRTFHNVLEKLGQYNKYLENMSSRLSHELRTPVAIVNSSLENLALNAADGTLDSQDNEYIERAQSGIKRLSKILTNMSEATRLEQAIQTSDFEVFSLGDLLAGCTQGYEFAYPNHRFTLSGQDSDLSINGSPELFAQMLDKIIANATEFSPTESNILITQQTSANKIQINIDNSGPPLPEKMQHQLMDSMVSVRADSHHSNNTPHLGLGLYIAKLIAEFHGGTIHLQNLPDEKGVRVCIELNRQ